MKIKSLHLNNFGSYEGQISFEFDSSDNPEKNIVIIGGKNGTGKTTLFTAIRLCLYGHISMGYKNPNSYYKKSVKKLFNNTAKLIKSAESSIGLDIQIENGQQLDNYILRRSWILNETIDESFNVLKNDILLNDEDRANFEKFIIALIPPELLNLYFFDGEKIADFFLNDGSNERIKQAFLTIYGYDTFDIMYKNFKRNIKKDSDSSVELNEYLVAKKSLENELHYKNQTQKRLDECKMSIQNCDAEITILEKKYAEAGGITQQEWDNKILTLKEEEKRREELNSWFKKISNDVIPFLICFDNLVKVKNQITIENNNKKYRNFVEVLKHPAISSYFEQTIDEGKDDLINTLDSIAANNFSASEIDILDLSYEQELTVMNQIKQIIGFDKNKITKAKTTLKESLNKTKKIRRQLDRCTVENVSDYLNQRSRLFEIKSDLLEQQIKLEEQVQSYDLKIDQSQKNLLKTERDLENTLKKSSINNISANAIIMLNKLQDILYKSQLRKMESIFREEIKALMQKKDFIDDIYIDDDFEIHIYQYKYIPIDQLISILTNHSNDEFINLFGEFAFIELINLTNTMQKEMLLNNIKNIKSESLRLPVEIDKSTLSNGEKQIFIMALYYSLVKLRDNALPFIIDTPFARIDKEHRENIIKYFFSKLDGQVLILSTNEEINSHHIDLLKEQISIKYLLTNENNIKTTINKNSYF